jgi:glycosyltransferase involved in cell wall biosynthesis
VQSLAQDERIKIVGAVRDIRPHLQQATVAVAPLTYGAGIQNKVLEAMACATPVVASPQAVSALSARAGQEVLIAREPAAFAEAVAGLLQSRQWQRQVGDAGRRFVECHHRWNDVTSKLERIYDELVRARN